MTQIPHTARQFCLTKFEGPDSLVIRTFEVPQPNTSEVLVKIHAVALNHRDVTIASNTYPAPSQENVVPCSDMAGEVVTIGGNVQKWKVGDRVCANFTLNRVAGNVELEMFSHALGSNDDGVLTEYRIFPEDSLVSIPEHLSYQEASTLPCAAVTAWNALQGGIPLKGGDYVLIQGTGGVAIFALQLAVACGAVVIITSSSDEKLEIAKKLGARHVINYVTTPDWDAEVLRITNGRGADQIIEVGGTNTIDKSLNCVCLNGAIQVVGFVAGQAANEAVPLGLKTMMKAVTIRGVIVGSRIQFEAMNRLLAAYEIKPLIDSVYKFEDSSLAYKYLETRNHVGKVVIQVSED